MPDSMLDRDVITIGIIGAGPKGAAMALHALRAGYKVILEDISSTRLFEAKAHIVAAVQLSVAGDRLDSTRGREISANFLTTHSIDEVSRSADLLIEAAPEDAELQLEIFTIFDKFAKPHAILASTARAVAMSDLAEMTNCAERCVGLQFPEPGTDDRTLHIVHTPKTSKQTLQICSDFATTVGLAPAIICETAPAPAAREVRTS
jgi:3-hydroxyacyl-CoA dehydrogenase